MMNGVKDFSETPLVGIVRLRAVLPEPFDHTP